MAGFPSGRYSFGGLFTLHVVATDGPTGLVSNTNPLDNLFGDYVYELNVNSITAASSKIGIAPEFIAFWFVAYAAGQIAVQKALPRSGDVDVTAESVARHVLGGDMERAHLRLGRLAAIELTRAMLFRLLGRDYDVNAAERMRHAALRKEKADVGPIVPGQYADLLGAWGDSVDTALQKVVLPYLHQEMGVADGRPMVAA